MAALSTCARTPFGLTTRPQSTAHTRRLIFKSRLHRNFRDCRDIGVERIESGDTASLAVRKRFVPCGSLGGEPQNPFQAGGIERQRIRLSSKLWNFPTIANELQAKCERILSCSRRKLVHKTLDHETSAGVLHRAPPRTRGAGMRQGVLDPDVG